MDGNSSPPTSPVDGAPAAPTTPPVTAAPASGKRLRDLWLLGSVAVVAALALFLTLAVRTSLQESREELGRRVAELDSTSKEARTLARQAQEQMVAAHARLGVLETRLGETQDQQAAIEAAYQEIARARAERILGEVDQAIGMAVQQLQLAGNVSAALKALQNADAQLAAADRPQFLPLRRALAHDIDRLKALPLADISSISLQLESMLGRIEALPLGFERAPASAPLAEPAKPKRPAPPARAAKNASAPVASAPVEVPEEPGMLSLFFDGLLSDLRSLIRIERLDRPEPALLAPANAAYLRENIRLRLLSARLALLQRDGRVFNEDIRQARLWLERYFDSQSRPVASMLDELRQLEDARLQVEFPSLSESETALRALTLERR